MKMNKKVKKVNKNSCNNIIHRGDYVLYSWNNSIRKGIVIQNNVGNKFAPTTIIIEINERRREVTKPNIKINNEIIEISKIKTISKERILRTKGSLKSFQVDKLNHFLLKTFDFNKIYVTYAKLINTVGSEQSGQRPVLYLKDLHLILPLTTKIKKIDSLPTHSLISKTKANGLNEDSVALAEHLRGLSNVKLETTIGYVSNEETIKDVKKSIRKSILE